MALADHTNELMNLLSRLLGDTSLPEDTRNQVVIPSIELVRQIQAMASVQRRASTRRRSLDELERIINHLCRDTRDQVNGCIRLIEQIQDNRDALIREVLTF